MILNAGFSARVDSGRVILAARQASPKVEVVPVNAELRDAGWQRCRRYADKDWDWIDCVSFELMDRWGVREALSLDRHFAQAGFTLLVR